MIKSNFLVQLHHHCHCFGSFDSRYCWSGDWHRHISQQAHHLSDELTTVAIADADTDVLTSTVTTAAMKTGSAIVNHEGIGYESCTQCIAVSSHNIKGLSCTCTTLGKILIFSHKIMLSVVLNLINMDLGILTQWSNSCKMAMLYF